VRKCDSSQLDVMTGPKACQRAAVEFWITPVSWSARAPGVSPSPRRTAGYCSVHAGRPTSWEGPYTEAEILAFEVHES
jgi:hypothetical protein